MPATETNPRADRPPTFAEPLHVGRPNVGDVEAIVRHVRSIAETRWLTNGGPLVQQFERRVADFVGARHCIAMCNATVALEIALRAAGVEGEVILPAFTFVATAHALAWQEITPVFADIDAATHNLDPATVEALITPRTTAILAVHLWGRSADVERLTEIAARHRLKLMFDAAHAFGCSRQGRRVGCFGLAEVFSFHATKFVNCGEGGAVLTDDDELARRIRLMQNFGFVHYDQVESIGTNGKMSEMAAALGLASIDRMAEFLQVNQLNYAAYAEAVEGLPGIRLLAYDGREQNNYQYVVLEVDEQDCPLTRDQLIQVLHAENVLARRYFFPGVHRMEPYRTRFPDVGRRLPATEAIARRVLVLPTGTAVGPTEIAQIGQILRTALDSADDLRRQFPPTIAPPRNMLSDCSTR